MDTESRLAVLEVKNEVQDERFSRMENSVKETYNMVFQVKERLDKQNGAIPHLVEDVKNLTTKQDLMFGILNKNSQEDYKTKVKISILWGILGAASIAAIEIFLKLVLKT